MHGTGGHKRCAAKRRRGRGRGGGEKHGRASDSFLHGTGNKRVDWLKGRDAGRESAKRRRKEGGGAVTKMLRGPYSHSHGAQWAVIKLPYQTGRLWGGGGTCTQRPESSRPRPNQEAQPHCSDTNGRPLIAVNMHAGRLIIL